MNLGAMPLVNDYSLCTDAVTVYHKEGETVTRTYYGKAFFDSKKVENVERTGSTEANGFLLVIPGDTQACHVGDKVYLGEGVAVPENDVMSWWRSFIPTKIDNLTVVKYVDVKRWNGAIVHTEAGG